MSRGYFVRQPLNLWAAIHASAFSRVETTPEGKLPLFPLKTHTASITSYPLLLSCPRFSHKASGLACLRSGAPAGSVDAAELGLDVGALVERQPAAQPLCLAGAAVRELRVGVQTRTGGVRPCSMWRLPGCDDPVLAVLRPGRGVGTAEHLVVVVLLLEAGSPLQHHAVLDA